VHPAVLDTYLDRSLFAVPLTASDSGTMVPRLSPEEAVVLAFLKQHSAQQASVTQKAS
jgi:hypothetical protein